jgi:acylphosphatase
VRDDRPVRRISFVVTGRVQGVGFRASAAAAARRLQLSGFVRNRHDGAVEGHAQGDEAAVASFVQWLHRGPSFARVDGVELQDLPRDAGAIATFDVRV